MMKMCGGALGIGMLIYLAFADTGFAQIPFYAGKTITVVVATDPGGSGDLRTKAVVSVLKKYIPGNPSFVFQYVPGGGGRKAANQVSRSARPDGLTIGAMLTGFVQAGVLGESGVLYDVDKTIYLGSQSVLVPYIFLSRKGAGLNTLEKLRTASNLRIGAPSVGHVNYAGGRLFAYVLGIKNASFVTGYSPSELDLVLERGEIDARVSTADSLLRRGAHWIEKDLVDFHSLIEIPKGAQHPHPRIANLPDLEKFARSNLDRSVVSLYRLFREVGMPLILPPDTPRDRIEILQEAMRKTFRDPEYSKEFEKLAGEGTPIMPEDVEKAIRALPREPEVIDQFKKLYGPDPLPLR